MNTQEILERTVRARNTIGLLSAEGVENMRKIVNVYDYMHQTALMLEQAINDEKRPDPDKD